MTDYTEEPTICPNYGQHKYFAGGKTYTDFVPYQQTGLYQRTEYLVLACQCGDVIRKVVEDR